ncbi:hypothetical protein Rrhod_3576 [Rhodococcus rhodnii LMG 5362]|uniref:Uncharacterized protein n=1 Tax=Rhodococcus rhodnii LMG 5362 TaxID=1273125 RepID=R7WM67_9NOCA|nr:hypothetical protein Rrhod_3576 [Rhodococcus rhodnii LMG 5362]
MPGIRHRQGPNSRRRMGHAHAPTSKLHTFLDAVAACTETRRSATGERRRNEAETLCAREPSRTSGRPSAATHE